MKVLLIGSKGQLGTEISLLAETDPAVDLAGLDYPEVDVCDAAFLRRILDEHRPRAVINTAAFHQVDRCEKEVRRSFEVNAFGALNIARETARIKARLIHFSTDYVFHDNPAKTPFTEDDPPDPRSVYAVSKRSGELLIAAYHPDAVVVRTCGLYGAALPAGKQPNFVQTMLRLARSGKRIRVVDDQVCTPTWTRPLAKVVLNLLGAPITGVVHATCQGACSWFEFARAIFELEGIDADLHPVPSGEYPTPACRPPYSVLDNAGLREAGLDMLPHWREALEGYLRSQS